MAEKVNNKKRKRSPALIAGLVLIFLLIVILVTLAMFASFDAVTNVFEAGKVDIVLTETKWNPEDAKDIVPNTFLDKNPTIINKEDTVNTYVFMKVTVPYDDDPDLVIEYAYQDNADESGKRTYKNTDGLKIPVYEFVVTGEKSDGTGGSGRSYDQSFIAAPNEENAKKQEVNPGWYLLDGFPTVDTEKKTYTYLYAHVRTDDSNAMVLDPQNRPMMAEVIARQTVIYPLFNEIYLQNFRERDKSDTVSTAFPDQSRDYNIHIEAYGIQANFLKQNNTTTTIPEDVWTYIDKNYTYTP